MCVCVCVCKLFFFVKDFSGTTAFRTSKFGTNVGYDLLYCVKENQPPPAYHSLYLSIFLSPIKISVKEILAPVRTRVLEFCIHPKRGQIYCGKENQDVVINFCLLFPLFLYSISHSNVIHREICVKDFSGTTTPRILKFGTNVGYELLFYINCFSFSPSKFSVTNFSSSMRARVFKFCIHIESGQVYCGTENKTAEIYFAFFFLFPISLSNVIHKEICDKYFLGTIARRIL